MFKKYNNSLVLGKMIIPHLGHVHLINTALKHSNLVHCVIGYNNTQMTTGEDRLAALKEHFKDVTNIRFYLLDDGHLPQSDSECSSKDEFYALWCPEMYKLIPELDCVFTSEDYGTDFAYYLGIEHFLVDKQRITYPISGTMIRENIMKHYDFIIPTMKYMFNKKVAILGAESVGKSTLVEQLAKHYNTTFTEEYGRTLCEQKPILSEQDFVHICKNQFDLCSQKNKEASKIFFSDTEAITTHIFHKLFYPTFDRKISEKIEEYINSYNFDLYVVLDSGNTLSVQDGTRKFLNNREHHTKMIIDELLKFNKKFVVVKSDTTYEDRFSKVVDICDSLLV